MDLGRNRTNHQFLKTRPDAQTEDQKEDMYGRMVTRRPKKCYQCDQCVQCDRPLPGAAGQARQGARYGKHGRAVRSRKVLITSVSPGV